MPCTLNAMNTSVRLVFYLVDESSLSLRVHKSVARVGRERLKEWTILRFCWFIRVSPAVNIGIGDCKQRGDIPTRHKRKKHSRLLSNALGVSSNADGSVAF